jgi:hypothetical protein
MSIPEGFQEWLDSLKTPPPPTKLQVLLAFPTLARELGYETNAPLEPWTIRHKPEPDQDED